MRKFLWLLVGVVVLALAGCVYPGYTYVRGGYGGGYYTGAYSYDDYAPAYPAYYYDDYGCCGWYTPSISIGLGYYGGYYGRGYRVYRDRYHRGGSHWDSHYRRSQGHRRGGGSHGGSHRHH